MTTNSRSICVWDDCDQEAIYCPGHAAEFMLPELRKLSDTIDRLERELAEARSDRQREHDLRVKLAGEIEEAHKVLRKVRDSLVCTRQAPFAYDADHVCERCGPVGAYAKDLIDETLGVS